jgi:hypothetical protein
MSRSFPSFFAITAALLLLPGCWVGDGRYVIRGKVYARSEEALKPVRGATVVIGDAKEANRRAETPSDGTYAVSYAVGGMFPFIATGNPKLAFTAPGFEPRTVELQGPEETPDVKRRPCEPPRNDCFVLDVVLVPLPDPAALP